MLWDVTYKLDVLLLCCGAFRKSSMNRTMLSFSMMLKRQLSGLWLHFSFCTHDLRMTPMDMHTHIQSVPVHTQEETHTHTLIRFHIAGSSFSLWLMLHYAHTQANTDIHIFLSASMLSSRVESPTACTETELSTSCPRSTGPSATWESSRRSSSVSIYFGPLSRTRTKISSLELVLTNILVKTTDGN